MSPVLRLLICLLLAGLAPSTARTAGAAEPVIHRGERIVDFHAVVRVLGYGDLEVTETIRVQARAQQIRRGIFRDLPLYSQDRKHGFRVVDVRRDGEPENWFQQVSGGQTRIYIGRKNYFLPTGTYTYQLTYRTDGHVIPDGPLDTLYWNVTGNNWAFPIDHAGAEILLPEGVDPATAQWRAFTGKTGFREQKYRAKAIHDGVRFESTAMFGLYEGLSVQVEWPAGSVEHDPSRAFLQRSVAVVGDWFTPWSTASTGGLLVFFVFAWRRFGRDPAAGSLVPHYQPRDDLSPAAMRYIRRMGYDQGCFTTALISLAVQGCLKIEETADGDTRLVRAADFEPPRAAGERVLLARLFREASEIDISQENQATLELAKSAHWSRLKKEYASVQFHINGGWTAAGLGLVLLATAIQLFSQPGQFMAPVMVPLMVFLFGIPIAVAVIRVALEELFERGRTTGHRIGRLLLLLVGLGVAAGVVFAGTFIDRTAGRPLIPIMGGGILLVCLFYEWLKAPTHAGRKTLDHIDGFREYLLMAEHDELKLRNPPDRTPQLFERFLPHAVALDCAGVWGDKFEALLRQAQYRDYQPHWHSGSHFEPASLCSALESSVAAASYSGGGGGGGGGGGSGGGGGGGGGGGW